MVFGEFSLFQSPKQKQKQQHSFHVTVGKKFNSSQDNFSLEEPNPRNEEQPVSGFLFLIPSSCLVSGKLKKSGGEI